MKFAIEKLISQEESIALKVDKFLVIEKFVNSYIANEYHFSKVEKKERVFS